MFIIKQAGIFCFRFQINTAVDFALPRLIIDPFCSGCRVQTAQLVRLILHIERADAIIEGVYARSTVYSE